MSSEPREGCDSNSVMWGGGGCRCDQGSLPSSTAAGDTAASNEPSVDRHKGVMLQRHDRWDDAQIYDAHGRDCISLNSFLPKRAVAAETTYDDDRAAREPAPGGLGDDVVAVEMFTKELTPSDVGKLNRLVIPKKYATQHFSHVAPDGSAQDELLMKFVDKEGHWWAFRYCYWKSSQSYVFTKGWNRFVKEKRLCAKDTVAFYQCNERNGLRRPYCLIDIIRHVENNESKDDRKCREDWDSSWSTSEGVEIGLGLNFKRRLRHQGEEGELKRKMKAKYEDGEVVSVSIMSPKMENKKRLKLFGEWIKIE